MSGGSRALALRAALGVALGAALGGASGGAAAAYTSEPPPATLPEGVAFNANPVTFNANPLTFSASPIGFEAATLTPEIMALAPAPEAPPPPPPPPPPLAEELAVTEEADGAVRYTLAADILFDFDSDALRPEARAALAALGADVRARFPDPLILVEGHTDARGSDGYNQALSERRAASVAAVLSGEEGFAPAAIRAAGLGEARPRAPNETAEGADDPEGRQLNRRVEIVVRPAG